MRIVRLRLPDDGSQRTLTILRIHELARWLSRNFSVSARDLPESERVWRIEVHGEPETPWGEVESALQQRLPAAATLA